MKEFLKDLRLLNIFTLKHKEKKNGFNKYFWTSSDYGERFFDIAFFYAVMLLVGFGFVGGFDFHSKQKI